ncbi:MAG: hypothetical protein LKE47_11185 [Prevotella sp.]|jgi:hypothetical protein|nr:hypothetical protein [Prevotella sp.]MCH3970911.1 hypothetical protein [Prevotella sp.]
MDTINEYIGKYAYDTVQVNSFLLSCWLGVPFIMLYVKIADSPHYKAIALVWVFLTYILSKIYTAKLKKRNYYEHINDTFSHLDDLQMKRICKRGWIKLVSVVIFPLIMMLLAKFFC